MAGPAQSTTEAKPIATMTTKEIADAYWKENIRLIAILLSIWAFVSYGCATYSPSRWQRLRSAAYRSGSGLGNKAQSSSSRS